MTTTGFSLTHLLLAFTLVAPGCGGSDPGDPSGGGGGGGGGGGSNPCARCTSYQVCTPDQRCVVNPTSRWLFGVDSAVLSKTVNCYFKLDGQKSTIQKQTSRPQWGEGLTYAAQDLLDKGVAIEFFDSGLIFDTSLSQPRRLVLDQSVFTAMTASQSNWDQVQRVDFFLRPQ